jgi:NAD(P)-dependent dehydrogenase (short-subunit alcohol dehydrogenase family)
MTKEDDWAAVVAATTKHFGKLDVLVNNAGISGSAEQDFYSTEAWHRIMAVNATGVFFGTSTRTRPWSPMAAGRSSIYRRLPALSAASTSIWPTTPQRRRYG